MEPTLYEWYSTDDAVAAFGADPAAEWLCDGEFVVLPGAVLGFGTASDSAERSCVSSPSTFVWRPSRLDYEPSGKTPWLPEKVRDVWRRDVNPPVKLRDYHIFLRTPADELYAYAGIAHLGCYGNVFGDDRTRPGAEFSLNTRLPREIWLKLGGYPGWLIEVNHTVHRVAAGDLSAFEHFIRELPRKKFSHLRMTRYEEDSLTVHTNARRGWLMYLRDPGDSGLYTRDPEYGGDPKEEELFRCGCGISLQFPPNETLPRVRALEAAIEFFRSGRLPVNVPWEPA
jgi:hypothetical protein